MGTVSFPNTLDLAKKEGSSLFYKDSKGKEKVLGCAPVVQW